MTVHRWRCRNCNTRIDAPGTLPCPVCGLIMTKDWTAIQIRPTPAFQPHFNHAVGKYVSNSREFDEALRRGSEAQNTTYSRIDPGDYPDPPYATEAIEASERARFNPELSKSKIIT